jgi:tetratricopeptide (TPR) repeat protein
MLEKYLILQDSIHIHANVLLDGSPPETKAAKGLIALSVIIIIPVLIALFFLIRFLYKHTFGRKLATTVAEDYRKEAADLEKSGKYVSAAAVYEKKLKDYHKAASLYERGRDYNQAAILYDLLGKPDKAKEMYEKAGSPEDAAEVALMEGEFDEAARFYDRAGKKADVAKVMQQAGKTIYAVKAYREAGDYKAAAMLLRAEGMFKEAAEMFGFHLHDRKPDASTAEDFFTYALMLEKTGDVQKATEVLIDLEMSVPEFREAGEKLQSLLPPFEEEDIPEGKTSLRSFIRSGRIDPKYTLKLWVRMLKSLQEAYRNGRPYGLLSPESIAVDAGNNVSFFKKKQDRVYAPPERSKGYGPDERSDIYSAGVILYEMLTGSTEGIGHVRVADVVEDVPDWLDELVIKCLRKVREDRYENVKEVFTDLKILSKGGTDSERISG